MLAAGRSISISHIDKLFWPEDGLTKGDMVRYYLHMAAVILPYFKDRPVTLRLFPDGIHGLSYYRRDLPNRRPAWVRGVEYRPETSSSTIYLPLIDDADGLIWFANQGCIEFHLWSSRQPSLAEPDYAIFDLDPGDEAAFADVLRAAMRLHTLLERLGLQSYAKTSGGRGLHVYVPLASGHSFDTVRAWVRAVSLQLAESCSDLIATAHGPTHRGHLVTIDHGQNAMGRNTAAPYTLRALAGAPVSTPLTWEEVERGGLDPSTLTLQTIPYRLQRMGDFFAPALAGGEHLR